MTDRSETAAAKSLPHWIKELPVLSGYQSPVPALAGADTDLDAAFQRLGDLIGGSRSPMTLRIRLSDGRERRTWLLDADYNGCRVSNEADRPSDLEATMHPDTWTLIARGELSPLDAFAQGRMNVRGSMRAARSLAHRLYRRDKL